jgi:hypothetical protein
MINRLYDKSSKTYKLKRPKPAKQKTQTTHQELISYPLFSLFKRIVHAQLYSGQAKPATKPFKTQVWQVQKILIRFLRQILLPRLRGMLEFASTEQLRNS